MDLVANKDDLREEGITSTHVAVLMGDVLHKKQNWVNWAWILTGICHQTAHQSIPVLWKFGHAELYDSWPESLADFTAEY